VEEVPSPKFQCAESVAFTGVEVFWKLNVLGVVATAVDVKSATRVHGGGCMKTE
jgi:hypothetical protein